MRDQVELSAVIQTAMKKKKLSPQALGKALGESAIMVTKIMCGEVVSLYSSREADDRNT